MGGTVRSTTTVSGQKATAMGGFVTIAVRDTGCGIPADKIDKIFDDAVIDPLVVPANHD